MQFKFLKTKQPAMEMHRERQSEMSSAWGEDLGEAERKLTSCGELAWLEMVLDSRLNSLDFIGITILED